MAENADNERLQPSLLDRLTDNAPGTLKETRDERVIDIRRLRDIVQRDLSWLLNTTNAESIIDTERYPNVAASVLNYGVMAATGEFAAEGRAELIRRAIRRAIEQFEPRLRPGSIEVLMRTQQVERRTLIAYDIRADLWAEPVPLEMYLRSEVDITSGEISLERVV